MAWGSDEAQGFTEERSFSWGVLTVGDARSTTVPDSLGSAGIAHSGDTIAVGVRHAQDFDAESEDGPALVSVSCRVGRPGDTSGAYVRELEIRSGTLAVGDPDSEQLLEVVPGRYRVEITRSSDRHADQVWIDLTPTSDHQPPANRR